MTGQTIEKAPENTAGRPGLELFLLSVASLFLELLVIRWFSSDFLAFSVFKTFPLATCFVGLGVGFAQKSGKLFRLTPWAVVQALVIIRATQALLDFSNWVFPSFSVFQWQHLEVFGKSLWSYIFLFDLALLILLLGPFAVMVCIGSRMAELFNRFAPLNAYCINIGGSIAGSLLFSLVSFAGIAPPLLLIPVALLILFYVPNQKPLVKLLPLLCTVGLALWNPNAKAGFTIYWSPYQKLEVAGIGPDLKPTTAQAQGIVIASNGSFYQYALDFSDRNVSNRNSPGEGARPDAPAGGMRAFPSKNVPGRTTLTKEMGEQYSYYNLPYLLKKPRTVLIMGAGSGNDVASALRHGAEHVDAVDIDPVILELGKKSHPERPYDSARVQAYCDDARHFMHTCNSRYDMIIFAGLDSHTVTGQGASVRLDNFVYTRESLQKALRLLNPDGLMVLSFCKSKSWLSDRLFCTIKEAAGFPPLVVLSQTNPDLMWEVFLSGPLVAGGNCKLPDTIAPFGEEKGLGKDCGRILTDDWPFVYVTPVEIDFPYLLVVATILLFSAVAARKALVSNASPANWQMFFLGAAFILLELQSITHLSLLYGSTWFTSSVVINGVLIMILIANIAVIKLKEKLRGKQEMLYAVLFLTLAASYFLPGESILQSCGTVLGSALITVIAILPMCMAGVIFANAFSQVEHPDKAFAFNLLGAVVGAMLEYLSNYLGINALVLVAAAIYLCSYICARSVERLGAPASSRH